MKQYTIDDLKNNIPACLEDGRSVEKLLFAGDQILGEVRYQENAAWYSWDFNGNPVSAPSPLYHGQSSSTSPDSPWVIGEKYFIRTATYHHTGRLKAVYPGELVLEDAAWIADSVRFSEALKSGEFLEVEPFHKDVIIPRGAIIDATALDCDLPREAR